MWKYRGFLAKFEIDEDEKMIIGQIINLSKDGITFAGETVEEAEKDFHGAVDDYLAWAKEEGFEPEKPYSGKILVRASPELHRDIATACTITGTTMNEFVIITLEDKVKSLKQNNLLAV